MRIKIFRCSKIFLQKLFNQERVTILIEQLKKFGVAEKLIFAPEDLLEKKNIPKVARCLASCVDLVNTFINRIAFIDIT